MKQDNTRYSAIKRLISLHCHSKLNICYSELFLDEDRYNIDLQTSTWLELIHENVAMYQRVTLIMEYVV